MVTCVVHVIFQEGNYEEEIVNYLIYNIFVCRGGDGANILAGPAHK